MRKPIIAGNWKMFKTIAEARAFAEALPVQEEAVEAVLCAPFTALPALKHGISPIVCVGEDLEQREAGQTKEVVKVQMEAAMKDVTSEQLVNLVIAYEPIWAIGTGKTSSAEDANEVIGFIRELIADQYDQSLANQVRIQYGGSVKPDNVAGFMAQSDIDGALVGGASLQPQSFLGLVKGAQQ